jgi:hypothetical protein
MRNSTFSKSLKKVLLKLELPTDKLLHLGRKIGPKMLELMEAETEDIRRMGNWNPSIFDCSYSSKIPITAIRQMAGFSGSDSKYYIPRSKVKPPAHLLKVTPVGCWVYEALEAVRQAHIASECTDHMTALKFLQFMVELNNVNASYLPNTSNAPNGTTNTQLDELVELITGRKIWSVVVRVLLVPDLPARN